MMPRSCVFCGGSPVTREHVWPGWFRRIEGIEEKLPHRVVMEERGEVMDDREWQKKPFELTVRAVCGRCNNGWMAELEEEAKLVMEGMLAGRGRVLHSGAQRTLAKWATKTAMMQDLQWIPRARAIFPGHYLHLYEEGEPAPGTQVWLAAYSAAQAAVAGVAALEVGTTANPNPERRNLFVWTFTVGRLAFQVLGTTDPVLAGLEVNWQNARVLRLWPAGPSVTWTSAPALNDIGLAQFREYIISGLIRNAAVVEP
jgi:hypothetical protein